MGYKTEKETAIFAVIQAAKLCQQVCQEIPPALAKQDKSPVTVADFGSQAIICKALKEVFPDTSIVGEEDAQELRQDINQDTVAKITHYVQNIIPNATSNDILDWIDYGNGTITNRFWTLDPIDGTKGFLRQDQYAIALALIEDGEVKLGILGCPALSLNDGEKGLIFVAVKGEGSYKMTLTGKNATKLQVVSNDDISRLRFVEGVEANHGNQEKQNAIAKAVGITSDSIRVDSQAKYGIVAAGEAALYLRLPSPKYPDYRENIWDHAAGSIVVEEAGGKVTDMTGKPLEFATANKMNDNRGVVVSNGLIHDLVIKALNN
ncbi:3'(2'),5'-bisphosphate nucleotidase [Geminocystis sp. NIES-3708]|uniref:3'(2'),5'-bisphosphate nucleotidase n=1 Tax=Geminocystis sp. NIES-3708 TaxID=1615909 RepID=UPI0005FCCE68|nr:3'(2'),5'-bisphosphate nucleotidase [Geminocystis sp. NIES-3708]BAQ61957.1 3'(2'),5'-bisphosphate nucleotidase [Geminocystis sp. NIES-3708]